MRATATQLLLLATLLSCAAQAQTFRDPMRPAGAAPAPSATQGPAALKLEGIISGATRVAIVNGRVVSAGDTIAGAQILEILADGVRYSRGGRVQTLLLPGAHVAPAVRVASSPEANKP